jgi:hypothetical protein
MSHSGQRMHSGSLIQALVSALGLALCIVGAGALIAGGLVLTYSGPALLREQSGMVLSLGWTLVLFGGAALASLVYASRRLAGRPAQALPRARGLRSASLALLLWPPVLAVGRALAAQSSSLHLLLPPLQLAAVALPIWWLVELAMEELPALSPQRGWGVLNFSLFGSTPLAILVEVGLALALLAGVVVVISGQPTLERQFEELSQRLLNSTSNPQAMARIYEPLLVQPWFIFALLAGLSGVIPLVEELFKPLAVWLFAGQNLSPAQGFSLGALSGAGFALVETSFSLANPSTGGWLNLAVGRAGTGLLHIGTAAMMGWALAEAWRTGRYARLGLTYLGMVCLHGLWNTLSVLGGYSNLLANKDGLLKWLARVGQAAPYLLGGLAVAMLMMVILANLRLRRVEATPAPANPAALE